jgi:hypothetical protein
LKIYLNVANEEDSGMGLVKKKEFRAKDYDSLYFDYFIPGNYDLDAQETQAALKDESSLANESDTQEDIGKVLMTSGCSSTFKYAKQMKEFYADYSPLFNDPGCSYCYGTGTGSYKLTLNENDIKYYSTCDKLKIKNITIFFIKLPDKKNQRLAEIDFGSQCALVTALKQSPPEVVTKDCIRQGSKCNCKFEGKFFIRVIHQIYIRDELSTQRMLCGLFYIPCILNNKFVSTRPYKNLLDNAGYFYQAMLDHERLHCVQYRMLTEALFKGQFASETLLPFFFGIKSESDILTWKEKDESGQERILSLADKICESIKDFSCCKPGTGECDKAICKKKEEKVRDTAVTMMESIIEKLFKSCEGKDIIELPAWHFFFIKFNQYKWGGQPCDKK